MKTIGIDLGGTNIKAALVDENGVNEIKGFKTTINLLPKIRVEVVVEDKDVDPVILKVREICATGHVGAGKIFVRNIEEAVRIRTGERGRKAL